MRIGFMSTAMMAAKMGTEAMAAHQVGMNIPVSYTHLYEASVGVTSVCPATMTIPKDELLEVMKNACSYEYSGGSHLVGINMEGPFISPAKKGAQAAENIMHCDYEYFSQIGRAHV